ncbi:MAG TPA: hypothetical protein PK400_13240 [Phycisphaerales bacterium]|nr:hypothetical protein [Phycisphaerales bacterium]HRQ75718.1 hypothetical protein [Phycisphaerales bacterium]
MKPPSVSVFVAVCAGSLAGVSVATAQWTDIAAINTPFVTKAGEQTQPKVAPTSDGGAYVSWFDNATGGYDVFMQRIDAQGVRAWDPSGVLVADRSFSSTQDYGMAVDTSGHAIVAFRDDRFGGIVVTASRVSPAGMLDWGVNGVQLPVAGGFIGPIRVAATSDGNSVVAWSDGSFVRVVKLDSAGSIVWAKDIVPASNSYVASYLVPSDAPGQSGQVIVLLTTSGNFLAPRHIHAQKLDASGNALWGQNPVVIYSGPSIQIGYFPSAIPDSLGGMVLSWYSTSPLQVFAQRVNAMGAIYFSAPGLAVSTDATRTRVSPDVTFDANNDFITVYWTEMNGAQSQHGVYGQRIDASGTRMWGNEGAILVPIGPNEITQVRALSFGDESLAAWVETLSFGNQRLWASRRSTTGSGVWTPEMLLTASSTSSKSRLVARTLADGAALMTWVDGRNDSGDIFGQRINADGTLGPGGPTCAPIDLNCDGVVDVLDLLILLGAWGACGKGDCAADLNADGVVDVLDLLILLGNWGPV